jgi:hypothetical protein
MDSNTTLLISSGIFSLSLLLLTAGTLWWMQRERSRERSTLAMLQTENLQRMQESQTSFLREIAATRAQQQQSLDQVFTGLITGDPQEYAAMRASKIQEAAQLQWLSSVEYAETQKAQAEDQADQAAADRVAIQQQFEMEQEELDAINGSVYGGVA